MCIHQSNLLAPTMAVIIRQCETSKPSNSNPLAISRFSSTANANPSANFKAKADKKYWVLGLVSEGGRLPFSTTGTGTGTATKTSGLASAVSTTTSLSTAAAAATAVAFNVGAIIGKNSSSGINTNFGGTSFGKKGSGGGGGSGLVASIDVGTIDFKEHCGLFKLDPKSKSVSRVASTCSDDRTVTDGNFGFFLAKVPSSSIVFVATKSLNVIIPASTDKEQVCY